MLSCPSVDGCMLYAAVVGPVGIRHTTCVMLGRERAGGLGLTETMLGRDHISRADTSASDLSHPSTLHRRSRMGTRQEAVNSLMSAAMQ